MLTSYAWFSAHFERSDAILERATALHADLVILNTEVGGQKAKAKRAEKIAARHDKTTWSCTGRFINTHQTRRGTHG